MSLPPSGSQLSTHDGPRQVVRSPDQVALHLPVAGPTSRVLAYAVDAFLLYTSVLIVVVALMATAPALQALLETAGQWLEQIDPDAPPTDPEAFQGAFLILALTVLLLAAAEIGYFVFWESVTGGRSPGKWLLGLRVMRDGGAPIDLRASLMRNVMRLVDVLPSSYLVGLLSMVISSEGKRLGDLAAGTLVVRLDRPAAAHALDLTAQEGEGVAFRFERAALEKLGVNERALARQTLRRLESLEPDQRDEALERSVDVLRQRLGSSDPVEPSERVAFLRALLRALSRL